MQAVCFHLFIYIPPYQVTQRDLYSFELGGEKKTKGAALTFVSLSPFRSSISSHLAYLILVIALTSVVLSLHFHTPSCLRYLFALIM